MNVVVHKRLFAVWAGSAGGGCSVIRPGVTQDLKYVCLPRLKSYLFVFIHFIYSTVDSFMQVQIVLKVCNVGK
jgi:hypothetical protein